MSERLRFDKKEENRYAAWLLMIVQERPAKEVELHDMAMLCVFYQQRIRKQGGKLALASLEEILPAIYWPARQIGSRKEVYAIISRQMKLAVKHGLLLEPQEGWFDITDEGREYLRYKAVTIKVTSRYAINYFSTRYRPNRTRLRQLFEKFKETLYRNVPSR